MWQGASVYSQEATGSFSYHTCTHNFFTHKRMFKEIYFAFFFCLLRISSRMKEWICRYLKLSIWVGNLWSSGCRLASNNIARNLQYLLNPGHWDTCNIPKDKLWRQTKGNTSSHAMLYESISLWNLLPQDIVNVTIELIKVMSATLYGSLPNWLGESSINYFVVYFIFQLLSFSWPKL